jgi:hypothetical protein
MKKLWKRIKKWYYSTFFKPKTRTKASTTGKTIVLGILYRDRVRHLEEGVTVITHDGIATIVGPDRGSKSWFIISFKNGRKKSTHIQNIFQYFVRIEYPNEVPRKIYPLSYSHYQYIHPDEDNKLWIEGTITKRNYFLILDEELEKRKHIPYFYSVHNGYQILEKLHQDKIEITIKIEEDDES